MSLPLLILYRIYQFCIMMPLMIVTTLLACLLTVTAPALGAPKWGGYMPAVWWARIFCWLTWVRVTVSGRENISPNKSYVFVANHQGAYDIFSVYGYLGHNFRWMMKKSLEKIPFVGATCKRAGHIFVDKSSPSAIRHTMEHAEKQLAGGMSVVVFPEGARTLDGKMHAFRRGAFMLATEFKLPVVPLTIDGAYKILPRTAVLPLPGHIHITIHKAILPSAEGHDLQRLMQDSYTAIESGFKH